MAVFAVLSDAYAEDSGTLEYATINCGAISLAQQIILERRALGGDQRAQFVMAYCAWRPAPGGPPEVKELEYAYFWSMIANCERQYQDNERDLQALEEDATVPLTYRRSRAARDLGERRRKQIEEEGRTLERISRDIEDTLSTFAPPIRNNVSRNVVKTLAGMGPSGLAALGRMRNCPAYPGFREQHVRAAIWQNLKERLQSIHEFNNDTGGQATWLSSGLARAGANLSSADEREIARFERTYGFSGENRLSVQEDAALGRMGNMPVRALQFALGAFRATPDFPSGIRVDANEIDNVYGAKTARLAKLAQLNPCVIRDVAAAEGAVTPAANAGGDQASAIRQNSDGSFCYGEQNANDKASGWLTPLQSRALICRAAEIRQDPYSYIYLANMFTGEIGYVKNHDKALYSIQRADELLRIGPPKRASTHKDFAEYYSATLDDYLQLVQVVKEKIYWNAAYDLFGWEQNSGNTPPYATVVSQVNARLGRLSYDGPNSLCKDELVGPERFSERFAQTGAVVDDAAAPNAPAIRRVRFEANHNVTAEGAETASFDKIASPLERANRQ